jgi:uncharacterized protein (DUF1800 family)
MADAAQIAHLLRRTEYVARPARVAALSAGTLQAAVDDVLDFSGPVALPANLDHDRPGERWDQWVEAVQWWVDRMVDAPKPMQEKMTFFWHGLFVSARSKVDVTVMLTEQNKLFRDNAIGNVVQLAKEMAIGRAMLVYLDNADNTKTSPNQNFARELMELFTLGVGNYTEEDVESSARAWTGHTIDWNEASPTYLQYVYRPTRHDATNKTFFGTTQNWDGPMIIEHIYNGPKQDVAARFLVTKLWEHFAHQGIPAQVLTDLAAVVTAADWEIKPLLRALLLRPEFYSTTAMQGMVRSPVDWVVALMYHTGYRSATLNPQWFFAGMGQEPLNPPNVSGWRPNGYWVNTSAFGARAEFADNVAWRLVGDLDAELDVVTNSKVTTFDQEVEWVAGKFGIAPLSAPTRDGIRQYVVAQRAAEPWGGYWERRNLLMMAMLAPEMHVA